MTIDANESVDEPIEMPSTTSNEGIEANLDAQSNDGPSPSSEENHEEKSNGVQKRINDLTAKRYSAEREANELRGKLEKYEANQSAPAQQATIETPLAAPSLPDDLYDDDLMRKYHNDMATYTNVVATNAATSTFENQQKQSLQKTQQAQHKEVIDTYASNAIRDGVDMNKLAGVEQTLNQAGITPELGRFLMNDTNGAKIAEYLADNPSEMYSILKMDAVSAGIEIATKIKPKVLTQTPRVSNAPKPIADVSGGGYVEKDDFDTIYKGYEII